MKLYIYTLIINFLKTIFLLQKLDWVYFCFLFTPKQTDISNFAFDNIFVNCLHIKAELTYTIRTGLGSLEIWFVDVLNCIVSLPTLEGQMDWSWVRGYCASQLHWVLLVNIH